MALTTVGAICLTRGGATGARLIARLTDHRSHRGRTITQTCGRVIASTRDSDLAAGATSISEPATQFYGDSRGAFRDCCENSW